MSHQNVITYKTQTIAAT